MYLLDQRNISIPFEKVIDSNGIFSHNISLSGSILCNGNRFYQQIFIVLVKESPNPHLDIQRINIDGTSSDDELCLRRLPVWCLAILTVNQTTFPFKRTVHTIQNGSYSLNSTSTDRRETIQTMRNGPNRHSFCGDETNQSSFRARRSPILVQVPFVWSLKIIRAEGVLVS